MLNNSKYRLKYENKKFVLTVISEKQNLVTVFFVLNLVAEILTCIGGRKNSLKVEIEEKLKEDL